MDRSGATAECSALDLVRDFPVGGGLHGPFLTTPSLCLTCVGWHHVNTFKPAFLCEFPLPARM